MNRVKFMVVICREGVSQVYPFERLEDALAFYRGPTTEQWSESFLVAVLAGPVV